MVNEGIVLGHKFFERGIEVDRARVVAIEKMPYPAQPNAQLNSEISTPKVLPKLISDQPPLLLHGNYETWLEEQMTFMENHRSEERRVGKECRL